MEGAKMIGEFIWVFLVILLVLWVVGVECSCYRSGDIYCNECKYYTQKSKQMYDPEKGKIRRIHFCTCESHRKKQEAPATPIAPKRTFYADGWCEELNWNNNCKAFERTDIEK